MGNKVSDYDTYEVNMKCPICDNHMVEGYLFHGTWIYVCEDCLFLGLEYKDKKDLENLKLFEKIRNTPVKKVLNYVLEDDDTDFGGVAFFGETVKDFIEDQYYSSVWELNKDLIICGIKPIEKFKN